MLTFGPIPSRRFGQSLGINNIPPKICSYACVYCQVGRTLQMQLERRCFYPPELVAGEVQRRVAAVQEAGRPIDVLSFVPDGEPTLDRQLGRAIDLLRPLGIDVVVITNGSLLSRDDVREDLQRAHRVSIKIDSVQRDTWRRTNRPHGRLDLATVLDGIRRFATAYEGELLTETMLVEGLNDGREALEELAAFLGELQPDIAYVAAPTRPPLESWVRSPDKTVLARAGRVLGRHVPVVESLTDYEGCDFAQAGPIEEEILATASVHPLRADAMERLLSEAGAGPAVVERLLEREELEEQVYGGHVYYVARLPWKPRSSAQ